MANYVTIKLRTETYYDRNKDNAIILVFSDTGGDHVEKITIMKTHDSEASFSKTYTLEALSEEIFKDVK